MDAGPGILAFALIAALSPVAFAAALAVIHAGRVQALAFGIGFVATQFLVCGLLVLLGGWTLPHREHGHPTLRALVEIGFGLWVLGSAELVRRRPPHTVPTSSPRTQAAVERLQKVHALTALAAGILLGIGGPKRLVITALAAASIAAAAAGGASKTVLVAVYSVIATVLVWAPVLVFEIAGDGAIELITRVTTWIARHQRGAMAVALYAVGAFVVVDGAVTLLT